MCPVDDTGRNSVKPSTMAMMIVCIKSIIQQRYCRLWFTDNSVDDRYKTYETHN